MIRPGASVSLPRARTVAGLSVCSKFPVLPEKCGRGSMPAASAAVLSVVVPLVSLLLVEGANGGHRRAGLAALLLHWL